MLSFVCLQLDCFSSELGWDGFLQSVTYSSLKVFFFFTGFLWGVFISLLHCSSNADACLLEMSHEHLKQFFVAFGQNLEICVASTEHLYWHIITSFFKDGEQPHSCSSVWVTDSHCCWKQNLTTEFWTFNEKQFYFNSPNLMELGNKRY